jgi:hypothetical protein
MVADTRLSKGLTQGFYQRWWLQMRVWRRKARDKKAKPLVFETLKALRAPARSAGEAEAMRPTQEQPKSFASKVASIITRLKPTPEELAEVRKIARKVTRRASSNRKGRRP